MLRQGTSSLHVIPPPPFPVLYRILRNACRPVLNSLFSFSAEGAEHLPRSGPFILAVNHHNYLDGVVLAVAAPRKIQEVTRRITGEIAHLLLDAGAPAQQRA